ncbi:MAG: alcohol dehydrogenase catalytic domain-containing protein [Acidobacteriota bacterium]|nr:alcohol dehydrogenase catalytic domain-containing protein [Acidobacteriota bacterium]
MQAVTFEGVGAVAYRTVADPVLTGADEALVRMEAAGLCGSDLHVYRGREPGPDPGTPLGHELAGTVVEVGAAVRRFRPGERVVAPFSTACGDCFYCRHELPARCERGALFGFVSGGAGLAGCQAELVRVPLADASLVAVPPTVPSELAVLAGDVLATGWFGAASAGAAAGSTVAVIGCGAVGISAVAAACIVAAVVALALRQGRRRSEVE